MLDGRLQQGPAHRIQGDGRLQVVDCGPAVYFVGFFGESDQGIIAAADDAVGGQCV